MANDRKRIFCTREFLRVRDFWRNEKNIAEMPWELKGVSASNSKDAKNSFAFVLGDAYWWPVLNTFTSNQSAGMQKA